MKTSREHGQNAYAPAIRTPHVMCGRTSLFAPQPEIEARFEATFDHEYEPRYNIAPGAELAVIHDANPETITRDTWGFVPTWAESGDDGPRPINARVESVAESRLFGTAFEDRRALVIADGYYEWAGNSGGKQPYRITVGDDCFAMAGIWSRHEKVGKSRTTIAILTTNATGELASIHDRMPVILNRSGESAWLESEPTEPVDSVSDRSVFERLDLTPISTLVNDPANNSPAVIDPVGGDSGQTGLSDFGAD
ncbi:MAG: SOS response-associated peptidase [Halodesulfurarchaeum sp.]|nr:SOS response-associated peptidase [Halodesulfurarchaeum sp.]